MNKIGEEWDRQSQREKSGAKVGLQGQGGESFCSWVAPQPEEVPSALPVLAPRYMLGRRRVIRELRYT